MNIQDYSIRLGINTKQLTKLLNFSNTDPLIIKYTNDPIRFKNLRAYKNWLKKERYIYTLINKDQLLCGILWFSREDIPNDTNKSFEYGFTFGIRLYQDARGKGLGLPFMSKVFAEFMKTPIYKKSDKKGFWLTTISNNNPAIKLYKRFGFRKKATLKNKTLMTYLP